MQRPLKGVTQALHVVCAGNHDGPRGGRGHSLRHRGRPRQVREQPGMLRASEGGCGPGGCGTGACRVSVPAQAQRRRSAGARLPERCSVAGGGGCLPAGPWSMAAAAGRAPCCARKPTCTRAQWAHRHSARPLQSIAASLLRTATPAASEGGHTHTRPLPPPGHAAKVCQRPRAVAGNQHRISPEV